MSILEYPKSLTLKQTDEDKNPSSIAINIMMTKIKYQNKNVIKQ